MRVFGVLASLHYATLSNICGLNCKQRVKLRAELVSVMMWTQLAHIKSMLSLQEVRKKEKRYSLLSGGFSTHGFQFMRQIKPEVCLNLINLSPPAYKIL